MSSKFNEFIAALGSDLGSPKVVDQLDEVLVRLLKLRDFAADVHGVKSKGPVVLAEHASQQTSSKSDEVQQPHRRKIIDIANLAREYMSDPRSGYHTLRHRTRVNYDGAIRRIVDACGDRKLVDLKAVDFERLYERWKEGGKVAMAHNLMTMLRTMLGFGASVIEDSECVQVSFILHRMKFEQVRARRERLTIAHINQIREQAHKEGRPSVALAQAFQSDAKLSQKDVVGEWVPLAEDGPITEITDGSSKWIWGIRWNEIDDDLVLTHITSAKQEEIRVDLKPRAMVMEELRKLAKCKPHETLTRARLPRAGAVIKSEDTGKPYLSHAWRRTWRAVANAAEVPSTAENRDSRFATDAPSEHQQETALNE
jgi:hypothetical protein